MSEGEDDEGGVDGGNGPRDGDGSTEQIPDPAPGRSVFADEPFVDPAPTVPHARPVLDGAAFGLYEDEAPPSRAPWVVGAVLAVAVLVVGFLVWRAVNTDADLAAPEATTTTTAPDAGPTVEALTALVPATLTTCVPPPQQPTDGPARVVLLCPHEGVPEALAYVLYGSIDDRDAAFDAIVAGFGVPADGGECAIGRQGGHDYIGVHRVGRVACRSAGGRVDFAWTSDEAPVLVQSGGGGPFVDHYRFWADLVERTDARFPIAAEQALLDRLPEDLRTDCARDLGLDVEAPGTAAVRCRPTQPPPDTVSSVQFAGVDAMTAWIDRRRDALRSNVFDQTADGCTSTGFGQRDVVPLPTTTTTSTTTTSTTTAPGDPPTEEPVAPPPTAPTTMVPVAEEPPPPPPDAAFMPYLLGGTAGQVLCFVDSAGRNVVAWTRDDSLIGSVAVADGSTTTMAALLAWFEAGGHAP